MPKCLLCQQVYYWESPVAGVCWTCFISLRA